MLSSEQIKNFDTEGYLVVEKFEHPSFCEKIRKELRTAIEAERNLYPNAFDSGMVHNCFMHGASMRIHLESKKLRSITDTLLCKNAIIYAYQASSLPPESSNYGSRIHVDCPRFIPGYRTNLGYILALQDFTAENGATWVLPSSHLSPQIPDESVFNIGSIQLKCKKGDAIFFDARLVHKAGSNHTKGWRHAITINFCRPFMRSRFDFPKLIKDSPWLTDLNTSARKFLGFDVRMPSTIDEFYRPPHERLYLPNQE